MFLRREKRHTVWACAVGAVVLLGGCTGQPSRAKPSSEGVPSARPTPSGSVAALAAYRAMWRDLTAASQTSDPAFPGLSDHAFGGALEVMKSGLRKSKREEAVSKGAPRVDPTVISADSREVTVRDCVDDSHWLLYKLNGELKDNVPGGHFRTDATVRRANGVWKVSELYMHEVGSC